MNRFEFLSTTLGLITLAKNPVMTLKDYDPLILIGKGSPKFVGSNFLMLPEVESALKKMRAKFKS